jgi:nucleotide-binding universal stress UspA family protein
MARPIVVAVAETGLTPAMVETVARLAGRGGSQDAPVTVVHVARVWGTSLGIQHPALQPNKSERTAAEAIVVEAGRALRARGVAADALVISGRDTGKTLAAAAARAGAAAVVVGRSRRGPLARLLKGPGVARRLLAQINCTLVVVE